MQQPHIKAKHRPTTCKFNTCNSARLKVVGWKVYTIIISHACYGTAKWSSKLCSDERSELSINLTRESKAQNSVNRMTSNATRAKTPNACSQMTSTMCEKAGLTDETNRGPHTATTSLEKKCLKRYRTSIIDSRSRNLRKAEWAAKTAVSRDLGIVLMT